MRSCESEDSSAPLFPDEELGHSQRFSGRRPARGTVQLRFSVAFARIHALEDSQPPHVVQAMVHRTADVRVSAEEVRLAPQRIEDDLCRALVSSACTKGRPEMILSAPGPQTFLPERLRRSPDPPTQLLLLALPEVSAIANPCPRCASDRAPSSSSIRPAGSSPSSRSHRPFRRRTMRRAEASESIPSGASKSRCANRGRDVA